MRSNLPEEYLTFTKIRLPIIFGMTAGFLPSALAVNFPLHAGTLSTAARKICPAAVISYPSSAVIMTAGLELSIAAVIFPSVFP